MWMYAPADHPLNLPAYIYPQQASLSEYWEKSVHLLRQHIIKTGKRVKSPNSRPLPAPENKHKGAVCNNKHMKKDRA